ncbi:hypothetical protein EMCRGX_G029473, partial [Ephydatia muelleri]
LVYPDLDKDMGEAAISVAVHRVLQGVHEAAVAASRSSPTLVAVSKKHSAQAVCHAYNAGLRHFGENYVQELHSKALAVQGQCKEIKWHFIGHLQRNKTKVLVDVPHLWMVETLESEKMAQTLNTAWSTSEHQRPLRVLVQVNTSRENDKHGCLPEACQDLVQFVTKECRHLTFCGLMTIGRAGYNAKDGPNPDFMTLLRCGEKLLQSLHLDRPLEFSMGMSADYHHAVQLGSTIVRIGSAIFGARS